MAGDWIKLRGELYTHPKFLALSTHLIYNDDYYGLLVYTCGEDNLPIKAYPPPEEEVVTRALRHVTERALRDVAMCALLRVWCAVNAHCKIVNFDAVMQPMTILDIDSVAGFGGFGDAMQQVGWVVAESDETLVFPNFCEFNEPACLRLIPKTNAERQRAYRERLRCVTNHNDPPVTKVTKSNGREEKRREDNKVSSSRAQNGVSAATSDRVSVLVSDCQHIAQKAFARIGYEGHDAGILWRAAALVSAGGISPAHFFDACEAVATTSPTNPIAYFRTALEERVPGLTERLQKVRLVPKCPHGPIGTEIQPIPKPTIAKVSHDPTDD